MTAEEPIVVLVTAGCEEAAAKIARALVEERLVACASLVAGVRSIYRWQGSVVDARECLAILKTERRRFADVERRVRELHDYEVPEIVALPIIAGFEKYLAWIAAETS